MLVRFDCRHFRGDRPCLPHKREAVHCDKCPHYSPVGYRILVVKLEAVGDVLRTTCILPGLNDAYRGASIDWLTREEAAPLFDHNPFVKRVIPFDETAIIDLATQDYDLVINLDTSPLSCRLATMARGAKRLGYGFDPAGFVVPLHDEAVEWFEMGLFDDVKRRNRKTYQQIVQEICGLPGAGGRIQLYLTEEERRAARGAAAELGLSGNEPIVGLNTGAGPRWRWKKWTEDGYVDLIRLLGSQCGEGRALRMVLLGGPHERDRNRRIMERTRGLAVDAGTGHSLRAFAALVDVCDLVVTGDTLALHLAAALGKKVVALFGPTSAAEIELYGQGIKIVPDVACASCYLESCDVRPSCMERITPEEVAGAVASLL